MSNKKNILVVITSLGLIASIITIISFMKSPEREKQSTQGNNSPIINDISGSVEIENTGGRNEN